MQSWFNQTPTISSFHQHLEFMRLQLEDSDAVSGLGIETMLLIHEKCIDISAKKNVIK